MHFCAILTSIQFPPPIGEIWLPIIASTNFELHVQKNKTPEKGTEKRLQPDKALGLVFQRLKHHKEALQLELC